MKYSDLTYSTPQQNLACDEALLELCEEGKEGEILRFWESPAYFVVVGYSNKIQQEVNTPSCEHHKIPVLRRPSGGGTVLQGPGCLNYSLLLKTNRADEFHSILKTTCHILKLHREAFIRLLGKEVSFRGESDLTLGDLKFSGNAQRRKKNWILFHGTFLLYFDIAQITRFLKLPSKEPGYRKKRTHEHFLINLGIESKFVKETLKQIWRAENPLQYSPDEAVQKLVNEKYSKKEWNERF